MRRCLPQNFEGGKNYEVKRKVLLPTFFINSPLNPCKISGFSEFHARPGLDDLVWIDPVLKHFYWFESRNTTARGTRNSPHLGIDHSTSVLIHREVSILIYRDRTADSAQMSGHSITTHYLINFSLEKTVLFYGNSRLSLKFVIFSLSELWNYISRG